MSLFSSLSSIATDFIRKSDSCQDRLRPVLTEIADITTKIGSATEFLIGGIILTILLFGNSVWVEAAQYAHHDTAFTLCHFGLALALVFHERLVHWLKQQESAIAKISNT